MDAASSPVGVAAAPQSPPPPWPQAAQWVLPPADLSVRLPAEPAPGWSRPAQAAAALFLLLALVLLGWHAWAGLRWSCRPAALETDVLSLLALDLNQADHAQLLQLPGVGENLARRIETYRATHHGFRTVDELRQVHGIGPKLLEKLRPFVYVEAAVSDEENKPDPKAGSPVAAPAVGTTKVTGKERIDLNHATAAELRRLPGIGPVLAQRILDTRAKQPFHAPEDLRRVPGIGPAKLQALRPYVVIVP